MGLFDLDDDYDSTFDFDGDGELNAFENFEAMEFRTSSCEDDEEEEKDVEDILALHGLDLNELKDMDEDERREALEDAGLDPDDFDF